LIASDVVLTSDLRRSMAPQGPAERERKGFHAGTEELDLELSIDDGLRLPDQLVQALFRHCAVALFVDIDTMNVAKPHRRAGLRRAHDEVEIAGVKTIGDAAIGLI